MIANGTAQSIHDETRTNALTLVFALAALMLGAFVVLGTSQELSVIAMVLLAIIAAWTVPLNALAVVLAALVPFQFYFFVPGTNFAAPAAFVYIVTAALRVLLTRGLRAQVWIVPAAAFLLTALIAAFGAQNRYEAFKGIYAWSAILACAIIAAETADSARTLKQIILLLVGLGVLQAILGLVEYTAGLERVLAWLSTPPSEFIFPPNILRERLSDVSFNWNLSGRALPFGTFINGIDYAVFLAAILMLALAQGFSSTRWKNIAGWFAAAFAMGAALLLTFKGSGLLAFVAGGIALAVYFAPRLHLHCNARTPVLEAKRSGSAVQVSRRMRVAVLALGLSAFVLALPFAGAISERAAFLIQREQSDTRDLGRLSIWLNLAPAFAQRPFFGYGMGNSPSSGEVLRTLRYGAFGTNPVSPESAYVQVLIETGAVGFIALITFFVMTFVYAARQIRENKNAAAMIGILAALVALWAGNLTVSAFTTDQNGMLMGLLMGLIFSKNLANVAPKNSKAGESQSWDHMKERN